MTARPIYYNLNYDVQTMLCNEIIEFACICKVISSDNSSGCKVISSDNSSGWSVNMIHHAVIEQFLPSKVW